jgi:hypothetical protein
MTTAATIAAVTTLKGLSLISAGICLGIGFWGSKKLTNYLDMRLALRDSNIKKLTEEYPYA